MTKKFRIFLGLFLATGGAFSSLGHAFGRSTPDTYLLNLCEYYGLYDTRLGHFSPQLVLEDVRVEAQWMTANCGLERGQNISVSEPVETKIHNRYIVELLELRDVLDRLHSLFESKLNEAGYSCKSERHLYVSLVFRNVDTGALVEMSPMDIRSNGRSGFFFEANGRSLALIERGEITRSPQEALQPQLRCRSASNSSR